MNNGNNIVYLGSSEIVQHSGDQIYTNVANLTALKRTFSIHKNNEKKLIDYLVDGLRATGYSNMYLWNPPPLKRSETRIYCDAMFYGVLETSEGGRGISYEFQDERSNAATYSRTLTYVQPVKIFQYTIPKGASDRSLTRTIPLPDTVSTRRLVTVTFFSPMGSIVPIKGTAFFWNFTDLERLNFGKFDQIRETWTLTAIRNL